MLKRWLLIIGLVLAGACIVATDCALIQPFEELERALFNGDDDDDD